MPGSTATGYGGLTGGIGWDESDKLKGFFFGRWMWRVGILVAISHSIQGFGNAHGDVADGEERWT